MPDPNEHVYFIAGDFAQPIGFLAWKGTVCAIQAIIGESTGFEYFVVQPEFRWLICENHHDIVIAIGQEVEDSLRRFSKSAR